jgi:hypothetical protein
MINFPQGILKSFEDLIIIDWHLVVEIESCIFYF